MTELQAINAIANAVIKSMCDEEHILIEYYL